MSRQLRIDSVPLLGSVVEIWEADDTTWWVVEDVRPDTEGVYSLDTWTETMELRPKTWVATIREATPAEVEQDRIEAERIQQASEVRPLPWWRRLFA